MAVKAAFIVPHPPLIVPQVGRGGEAQISATTAAYERVADEIAEIHPDTLIISSPHSMMYRDYFHISPGEGAQGSFAGFGAPEVRFSEQYDTELVRVIESIAKEKNFHAGTLGEKDPSLDHGTMVPLYFIRKKLPECKIVRIGLSGLPLIDHYKLGLIIQWAVRNTGRNAVYIASGDLSHKLQDYGPYGFAPEGPEYDRRIMDVCGRAAFGELFDFSEEFCDKAAECGHRSFVIMAGALDRTAVEASVLSHQDVTGVGYGICSFYTERRDDTRNFLDIYQKKLRSGISDERKKSDDYVKLALKAIESYVRRREIIGVPSGLPEEMLSGKSGAFVSIHKHGQLRGCIGTILPATDCIAREIIKNAISASTEDPRFDPISPDELEWLEVNVDILSEPEEIPSAEMLDVKRYGVIVSSGYKRGLLLPDLDGVDSVEQQIDIARRKGGISENEHITLQRFEVIRHY